MLPTPDLIRVGVSVVLALLLCTLRLRLVLWMDCIYSVVVGGCMVYFAKDAFSLSTSSSADELHLFLLRTRVVLLLLPAFTWLFCKSTMDITCRTALTLGRLVGYMGAAITMGIEHYRTTSFHQFHLLYGILPACLWSLVMIVQLVRTGSRVNIHIRRADINTFLTIDLILLLIYSLADLGSPAHVGNLLGRNLDPLHVYLHRINGCILLGLCVLPWIGARFRYSEDKHTIFMAQILCSLLWFGGIGFSIFKKWVPLNLATYVFLGQWGVLFILSVVTVVTCQYGPTTGSFWSSPRRAVTIGE